MVPIPNIAHSSCVRTATPTNVVRLTVMEIGSIWLPYKSHHISHAYT